MAIELEPAVDSAVPDTLISSATLAEKMADTNPVWVTVDGKAARDVGNKLGVAQRRLSNGYNNNNNNINNNNNNNNGNNSNSKYSTIVIYDLIII